MAQGSGTLDPVGVLDSFGVAVNPSNEEIQRKLMLLLTEVIIELRVHSLLLQTGLNVKDVVENLREDLRNQYATEGNVLV